MSSIQLPTQTHLSALAGTSSLQPHLPQTIDAPILPAQLPADQALHPTLAKIVGRTIPASIPLPPPLVEDEVQIGIHARHFSVKSVLPQSPQIADTMSCNGYHFERENALAELSIDSTKSITEESSLFSALTLPDEVSLLFFGYLGARELATCSSVCKHWQQLSGDSFLWKQLFMSQFLGCDMEGIDDYKKAYRIRSNHDEILVDIALQFSKNAALAGRDEIYAWQLNAAPLEHFSRMREKEKNGVYYELYLIHGSPHSDDFEYGRHAFHGTCRLKSTPEQKARAIHNYLARKIAAQFKGDAMDQKIAMEKFNQLPKTIKNQIYYEMYKIHNSPSTNDPNYGERAFHDTDGLSSTPEEKAQAILNYLGC